MVIISISLTSHLVSLQCHFLDLDYNQSIEMIWNALFNSFTKDMAKITWLSMSAIASMNMKDSLEKSKIISGQIIKHLNLRHYSKFLITLQNSFQVTYQFIFRKLKECRCFPLQSWQRKNWDIYHILFIILWIL